MDPIRAYLQVRAASSPEWLDGGDRIAFLTGITGIPQAWAAPADGGWPEQLTFGAERVAGLAASPDGSTLAFERDVGGDERHRLHLAEPERSLAEADAIHRLGAFSPDGTELAFAHTERNGVDFDLAVVDLRTGARRELAQPGGWCVPVDWSEQGLLVVRAFSNVDTTIYRVDPSSGAVEELTPHEGEVLYGSPRFLPDGSILCATDVGSEFTRLAVLRDGEPTFLTNDTGDVEAIAVHGERRAWTVNEEGYGRLYLDGEAVELPDGVPGGLAFSPDGSRLALHLSQPDDTTDVWIVDADRAVRRVTRSARGGLGADAFRRPELEQVESFDGREIPYLRYGPRDAPTLCWVHGGPESQERPALNAVIQYLVSRGLSVAAPNVRGSTGYGRTYTKLDDVERRLDSVGDLAALARALGAERGVPVGVMGGSYGGYMTLAAITEYPALWRAAVDVVGIANFVTFLERTGAYRRALREAEYGSLATHRDFLESISPLAKVDRIETPLMVIHGANDPRVPVEEAEQIVTALRERGRPVEYLRYEDEGHGLVRLPNRLDAYPRVAAFLERHLLGA
jgi:dipeptidyl aminopeptidase/acylaminoacyl peptidase